MVAHYPFLLGLTDAHGFSALHHAVMSGDAVFISKVPVEKTRWKGWVGPKGDFWRRSAGGINSLALIAQLKCDDV